MERSPKGRGKRLNRIRAYCGRCRHEQVFERLEMNHLAHLLLAICTLGLWTVSWVAAIIGANLRPYRCKHCGWYERPRGDEAG